MTDWKRHLVYGFGIEIVLVIGLFFSQYKTLNYIIVIQGIIIMFVSPLIMDLDHHNSKLREIFVGGGLIGSLIGHFAKIQKLLSFSLIFTSATFSICYFFKHRGFMHSIPFVLIYGVGLYFLTNNINLSLIGCVGCYSHLFFDKEYFKFW